MARKIGILGAGTWGIALARMLAVNGSDVLVWSAIPKEVEDLARTRVHPNLPGMVLPESLRFTKEIAEVCSGQDILVFAVPSVFVRSTAAKARPYIRYGQLIVDVAKGIEPETLFTMTEVLADELGKEDGPRGIRLVALSGPTHAEEVALDLPTTIVSASPDAEAAAIIQEAFTNQCMRVYTNPDIKGVELSGAPQKTSSPWGVGHLHRPGLWRQCPGGPHHPRHRRDRPAGCGHGLQRPYLCGPGRHRRPDRQPPLSQHSRNNRAGQLIGKGRTPSQAVQEVGMVVEGMNALPRRPGAGPALPGGYAHRPGR